MLTHDDLVFMLIKKYKSEYKTTNSSFNVYHYDENGLWSILDKSPSYYSYFSDLIEAEYNLLSLYDDLSCFYDESFISKYSNFNEYLIEFEKCYASYKNQPSKKYILISKFISQLLDPNCKFDEKNIISFKDGVYDLEQDVFRKRKIDDYLTWTLPYDYQCFDMNNTSTMNVLRRLNQIFDNASVITYVLVSLVKSLRNDSKNLTYIFLNNGSTFVKMIKPLFANFKHILFYDGDTSNEEDVVDFLTSNKFKTKIIALDFLPSKIKISEPAFWLRLQVIPCSDTKISFEKTKNLYSTLMSFIIHYNKFSSKILNVPESITDATSKYRDQNDIFLAFFESCLEFTNDMNDIIDLCICHEVFHNWYEDKYGRYRKDSYFETYLSDHTNFDKKKRKIYGYKLKSNNHY